MAGYDLLSEFLLNFFSPFILTFTLEDVCMGLGGGHCQNDDEG